MTTLEQRVLAVLGSDEQKSNWEKLQRLFQADREAFYQLANEGATEQTTQVRDLAELASQVRVALRESYELVSVTGGANLTSFSGKSTFIPAGLIPQITSFLREVDGKTTSTVSGRDYEGEVVSEAEVRFKLGDPALQEARRNDLEKLYKAKPFVLRLDQDELEHLATQPAYVTYELLHCARRTVLAPTAVFRGLKRGDSGPSKVNNGWAFCGKPRQGYRNDGTSFPAPDGMVHMVYADEEGFVFDWDWVQEDPDNTGYPLGPIPERFDREVAMVGDAVLEIPQDLRPGTFDPTKACYSSRGDCIFCYMTDEESFAERINADLTVFQRLGTHQHTGFKIKNVRRILESDQSIVMSDPPGLTVSVRSVLLATLKRHPEGSVKIYDVLIEALQRTIGKPPTVRVPPMPAKNTPTTLPQKPQAGVL